MLIIRVFCVFYDTVLHAMFTDYTQPAEDADTEPPLLDTTVESGLQPLIELECVKLEANEPLSSSSSQPIEIKKERE